MAQSTVYTRLLDFFVAENVELLTVNPTEEYQRILGFGGAFTDSATMNILNVSSKVQENLLSAYFSAEG